MARPLCIEYPGAVYHVMNRGGARRKVFLGKKDYEAFINTIGEINDYRALGWACHGVASRIASDSKLRERVVTIRQTCQQKI
jgi:hypothetical protein